MVGTPTRKVYGCSRISRVISSLAKPSAMRAVAPTASTPCRPSTCAGEWVSGSGQSTRSDSDNPRIGT